MFQKKWNHFESIGSSSSSDHHHKSDILLNALSRSNVLHFMNKKNKVKTISVKDTLISILISQHRTHFLKSIYNFPDIIIRIGIFIGIKPPLLSTLNIISATQPMSFKMSRPFMIDHIHLQVQHSSCSSSSFNTIKPISRSLSTTNTKTYPCEVWVGGGTSLSASGPTSRVIRYNFNFDVKDSESYDINLKPNVGKIHTMFRQCAVISLKIKNLEQLLSNGNLKVELRGWWCK